MSKYELFCKDSFKIGTRKRGKRISPKYGKSTVATTSATTAQAKRFGFDKKNERICFSDGRAFSYKKRKLKF